MFKINIKTTEVIDGEKFRHVITLNYCTLVGDTAYFLTGNCTLMRVVDYPGFLEICDTEFYIS
jgi:hypothetical protein